MADHRVLLAPGADTLYPAKIVSRYSAVLNEAGYSLSGSTVCVIGYGGSLGIGLYLLEAGAKRVILQDPFAPRRTRQDSRLNPDLLSKYCRRLGETWIPDKERIELFHGPLECLASRSPSCCDYVLSNSVLEHVRNISSLVEACWTISRNDGTNVHVVDLRDHVFEFPFEMLCYSERVWTAG